jgi:hypothetical protein
LGVVVWALPLLYLIYLSFSLINQTTHFFLLNKKAKLLSPFFLKKNLASEDEQTVSDSEVLLVLSDSRPDGVILWEAVRLCVTSLIVESCYRATLSAAVPWLPSYRILFLSFADKRRRSACY